MHITRSADYGIRVLTHLAMSPPGTRLTASELAEASHAPESLVAKILQRLVAARLVASRRGFEGGFELARPPREVSVLDIVTALEGPLSLNPCVESAASCEASLGCAARDVWARAQRALASELAAATLEQLATPRERVPEIRPTAAACELRDEVSSGRTP